MDNGWTLYKDVIVSESGDSQVMIVYIVYRLYTWSGDPRLAKFFDRDPETNEVLWFAAPPVDIAHPPGPSYSMEYLHFRRHSPLLWRASPSITRGPLHNAFQIYSVFEHRMCWCSLSSIWLMSCLGKCAHDDGQSRAYLTVALLFCRARYAFWPFMMHK